MNRTGSSSSARPPARPALSYRRLSRRRSTLSGLEAGSDAAPETPVDSAITEELAQLKKYEDFTTIDWVQDAAREQTRRRTRRKDAAYFFQRDGAWGWRRKLWESYDAAQAWVVVTLVAIVIGLNAAALNIVTEYLSDLKMGYCTTAWYLNEDFCCYGAENGCDEWKRWTSFGFANYMVYTIMAILLAATASFLVNAAHLLSESPQDVAEKMMQGKFERFKCTFGTSAANLPALVLEIPGLAPGTNHQPAEIQNSRLSISQTFLQKLFDEQVDAMIQLLTEQLVALQVVVPGQRVSYLVLSGGLGSSQYVQDRIKQYFQFGAGATLSNTHGMHMLLAEDPQLAVVLGLVTDRAQELGQQTRTITHRCARVSYGVVVNQKYDPQRHHNQVVYKDPRDKKKWALNQIEWLIREGDHLDEKGVSKHVRAKLQKAQLDRPWRAQFVISTERRESLPTDLSSKSVKTLCIVEADLRYIDRIEKNGHWWQLGQRYELAEFDLRLIPGSADLKFQLWNHGRLITGENESVSVDWGSGVPPVEQQKYFDIQ